MGAVYLESTALVDLKMGSTEYSVPRVHSNCRLLKKGSISRVNKIYASYGTYRKVDSKHKTA